MWSLVRISILVSCVAAGVAIAVGLAGHFAQPATRETGRTPQSAVTTAPSASPPKSVGQPLTKPPEPKSAFGVATPHETASPVPTTGDHLPRASTQQFAFPPAPYYMHYQEPRSDQIERLERALQRVAEASTQTQIKKLEAQLEELSRVKNASAEPPATYANPTNATLPAAEPTQPASPANQAQATPEESNLADVRGGRGGDRKGLNLRDQDLRELLEFLSAEAGLNILASENVTGRVTASLSDMDAESAILAILRIKGFVAKKDGKFLYVGTPADLTRMEHLSDTVKTRVYRTDYVTAAEMQSLIKPLLSTEGKVTVSSPAEQTIPADTVKTGGDDFAGCEVLMVQDYESVLRRIDEIVAQIDERPRQVMIEAMIISVGLDDSHSVGINFEAFQQKNNLRLVSGTPMANLGQINVSQGGLQFGVLDGNIGAFINALEGIGDTDVIAAPHLLCLNKQKAEILIGDQKGYLSTTQTETATTQTVEFLDLGTQLRIRPFISSDGMVRLEVHPELSTGDVKLVGTFALPEKSTTQVTTNIMCRDGCTVVIGGLIREDHARTVTQAAIIGNLPVLGELFRNKKIENQRSEIIVLLTPKIVHDPMICEDAGACRAAVSQRRSAVDLRRISPVARHHYGRRYYRLAQSAWYAGNIPEAHRYLEITLQLNPHDIMAKRLLSILMSGEEHALPWEQELPDGASRDDPEEIQPLDPQPSLPIEPSSLHTPPRWIPPIPAPSSHRTPTRQRTDDSQTANTPTVRQAAGSLVPLTPQPIDRSEETSPLVEPTGQRQIQTVSETAR